MSRAVLAGLAVALLAAGCGGDGPRGAVTRDEFTATMVERFGADDDRARCITDYVYEDYDADEIEVLAGEGMPALPQARWEPYLTASVTCLTYDEPLEGPG